MIVVALGIFTYHSMTFDHLLLIFFEDNVTKGPFTFSSGALNVPRGLAWQLSKSAWLQLVDCAMCTGSCIPTFRWVARCLEGFSYGYYPTSVHILHHPVPYVSTPNPSISRYVRIFDDPKLFIDSCLPGYFGLAQGSFSKVFRPWCYRCLSWCPMSDSSPAHSRTTIRLRRQNGFQRFRMVGLRSCGCPWSDSSILIAEWKKKQNCNSEICGAIVDFSSGRELTEWSLHTRRRFQCDYGIGHSMQRT